MARADLSGAKFIYGECKIYQSYDSVKDNREGVLHFKTEYINCIEIVDLSPQNNLELELKSNTIIIQLRNLDISGRPCNGTRLIVKELFKYFIKAKF